MIPARPLAIAPGHPAYEGHFPGRPILPAVVLLAEALAGAQSVLGGAMADWTISQAKFARAVTPGAPLELALEATGGGVRFEIRSSEGVVATGALARNGPSP